MANERRTRRYDTYGSLAYQPEYQRGTAAPARRASEPERERRPRVQPRTRTATRPQVEVRQQSAIAPFAILGFAAVTGKTPMEIGEQFWSYGEPVYPDPENREIYNVRYKLYQRIFHAFDY